MRDADDYDSLAGRITTMFGGGGQLEQVLHDTDGKKALVLTWDSEDFDNYLDRLDHSLQEYIEEERDATF